MDVVHANETILLPVVRVHNLIPGVLHRARRDHDFPRLQPIHLRLFTEAEHVVLLHRGTTPNFI